MYELKRIDGYWWIYTSEYKVKTNLTFDEQFMYDVTKSRIIAKHERRLEFNDFTYNQFVYNAKVLFNTADSSVVEAMCEPFKKLLPYKLEEL